MDYNFGIKHPYRRHHYAAKCADTAGREADPPYDGELQLLRGRSSRNSGQTQDHCPSFIFTSSFTTVSFL